MKLTDLTEFSKLNFYLIEHDIFTRKTVIGLTHAIEKYP